MNQPVKIEKLDLNRPVTRIVGSLHFRLRRAS